MTKIEWTDQTWNPVTGCTKISPGCLNCYAEPMSKRLKAMGQVKYSAGFAVRCHPAALKEPAKWRKPRMVFVASMGDLFHEDVPANFIGYVFNVMAAHPQHTFQVLTKRAARLAELSSTLPWPKNIWVGVSVEAHAQVDRISSLKQVPAKTRFVSFEPLIPGHRWWDLDMRGIAWAIIGGESGPGARLICHSCVCDIMERSRSAGTAIFFKQLGTAWAKEHGAKHPKGGDPEEWPEDLRVREWPQMTTE